jgi:transporter family protein
MFLFLGGVSTYLGVFKNYKQIDSKALTFIILSGIAGALSWLCYFYALKQGNASSVAALDRLSVVFVLVLSILFLSEAINIKTIIGAILITIGAYLFTIK